MNGKIMTFGDIVIDKCTVKKGEGISTFTGQQQLTFAGEAAALGACDVTVVSYILECIPEADIQIYRVHRESDRMEVILEDIVESPGKVSVYVEMFERSPSGSCLKSPLKTSQIVGEVAILSSVNSTLGPVGSSSRRYPSYTCPENSLESI